VIAAATGVSRDTLAIIFENRRKIELFY